VTSDTSDFLMIVEKNELVTSRVLGVGIEVPVQGIPGTEPCCTSPWPADLACWVRQRARYQIAVRRGAVTSAAQLRIWHEPCEAVEQAGDT
jgi:hypothetical protein